MTFSAPNYCRGVLIVRFGAGIEDPNAEMHLRNLYLTLTDCDRDPDSMQHFSSTCETLFEKKKTAKYELQVVVGFTELLAGPSQPFFIYFPLLSSAPACLFSQNTVFKLTWMLYFDDLVRIWKTAFTPTNKLNSDIKQTPCQKL